MNNLKMILFDGTELDIDAFGLPCHAVMQAADPEAVAEIWSKLNADSLKQVFVRQDGDLMFAYKDCSVNGQQSVVNGDGTLTVHFYLDGTRIKEATLTDEDREYITAAKILLGEEE